MASKKKKTGERIKGEGGREEREIEKKREPSARMHPNDTRHISLVCSMRSRTRAKVRAGTTGRVCDEVTNIPLVNAAIRERQRTAVSHSVIPPRPCPFVSRYSRYTLFHEICIKFPDSVSSN